MPDLPKDPPDLGSLQELRAALEGALLHCPAEAEPPELGPVLRLPLPPSQKLKLVQGREILRDNLEWNPSGLPRGLERLRTALNILEKYGRNLLSPRPPRHWRGVRFGNPVFRATVGAIQGGRAVLKLLGYTEESGEGLSFPPPPHGPHPPRVATVTADVLVLRAELDLLLLNQHPNPHFFSQILLGGDEWSLASDALPVPAQLLPAGDVEVGEGWDCRSCTFRNPSPNVLCQVCERPRLARRPQPSPAPSQPWPCPRCTFLNRGHAPNCEICGADHAPFADVTSGVATPTSGVFSATSGFGSDTSGSGSASSGATTSTSGVGTTTSGCDPASSGVGNVTSGFSDGTSGLGKSTSGVENVTSGLAEPTSADNKATSGTGNATSGGENSTSGGDNSTSGVGNGTFGCAEVTSGGGPAPSRDALRQRKLLEDGRRLVELVRAAESQGLPPESLGPAPFSNLPEASSGPAPDPESQIRHFRSRLGGALKALLGAGPEEKEGVASLGPFSLAEAAWAWLEGEGQPERARRILIGRRKKQLRLLAALGFPDPAHSGAELRRHRGSQWEALTELQRLRLRPFRLRHQQGAEPGLDFNQPDQQALVRQILATLPVASWGRASLVAGLGRELGLALLGAPSTEPLLVELVEAVGSCPDRAALRRRLRCECAVCGWGLPRQMEPLLVELVEAVGSCPDRAALRRRLRCECAVCGWGLPRQMMQWLPGCSCPLCPECFRLHFTVGLRERGVANLGCPSCGRPDLRDDAQRLWYWSTLEPACSFGFIFEAERGPARCPQCRQCCCPRCQLPWDPRHASLSCADFGAWIGSRDPPGPPQGLGAFLGDTGIACPQCGQRFALARGGCLHFQCSQCRHQFCSGCGAQFHRPGACPSPRCPLGGSLHGHHPRDCLFFLRDWEPARLQRLLQSGDVAFETEPPPDAPPNPTGRCPVQELKDFGAALRDEPCGRDTEPGHAGLCTTHYTEYLVSLVNRHGLDPAPLYDRAELRAAAERHLPAGSSQRLPGESEAEHELRMRRLLKEQAPVRPRPQGAGLKGICK